MEASGQPVELQPLERIGDSDAFKEVLIEILERAGWTVDRFGAFGGGQQFELTREAYELRGTSIVELFLEASRYSQADAA